MMGLIVFANFTLLCHMTVRQHQDQYGPDVPKAKDMKPSLTLCNSLHPFRTMTRISQNSCLREERTSN